MKNIYIYIYGFARGIFIAPWSKKDAPGKSIYPRLEDTERKGGVAVYRQTLVYGGRGVSIYLPPLDTQRGGGVTVSRYLYIEREIEKT